MSAGLQRLRSFSTSPVNRSDSRDSHTIRDKEPLTRENLREELKTFSDENLKLWEQMKIEMRGGAHVPDGPGGAGGAAMHRHYGLHSARAGDLFQQVVHEDPTLAPLENGNIRSSTSSHCGTQLTASANASAFHRVWNTDLELVENCHYSDNNSDKSEEDQEFDQQRLLYYDDDPIFNSCRERARAAIDSSTFDLVTCSIVLLNAFHIGMEADWTARNMNSGKPLIFDAFDLLFCIVFTLELALRMYAQGPDFLLEGWERNIFDFFLVVQSVVDELSKVLLTSAKVPQLGFLRALRLLRLVRVTRMLRFLHLVVELRTMVSSIAGSMKALFWAIMLYIMFIYAVGVLFTELVTDGRKQADDDVDVWEPLAHYFGRLDRTVLTLYACISGGINWDELVIPLTCGVSPLIIPVLVFYIVFCALCLMNVVTGIFLETAMGYANQDQSIYITQNVLTLFQMSELNERGEITWEVFKSKLPTKQLQELFNAINVDINEALNLFNLIDVDGNGSVDPRELIEGWLRLRGPAKALDLATVMLEMDRSFQQVNLKLEAIVAAAAERKDYHSESNSNARGTQRMTVTGQRSSNTRMMRRSVMPNRATSRATKSLFAMSEQKTNIRGRYSEFTL